MCVGCMSPCDYTRVNACVRVLSAGDSPVPVKVEGTNEC